MLFSTFLIQTCVHTFQYVLSRMSMSRNFKLYSKKPYNEYIDMKTDSIPEPEEDILPFCGASSSTCYNNALTNMSPSALYVPGIY